MYIAILDSIAKNNRHVNFNFNLIRIIKEANPSHDVIFFAEKNYIQKNKFNDLDNIQSQSIFNTSSVRPVKLSYLIRLLITLFNISKILFQNKFDKFFILEAQNYHILACFFISMIKPRCEFYFLFHGEIANEFIKPNSSKLFLSKFHNYLVSKFNNKKKITFLFLEEHIKNNIVRRAPSVEEFSFVLEHPLDDDLGNITIENPFPTLHKSIKIAYFGTATVDKGFPEFIKLAKNIPNNCAFLCCTTDTQGILKKMLLDKNSINFHFGPLNTYPNYSDYIRFFKNCDFVTLFLKEGYYDYAASGILCDCIRFEIPVIGIKTPYILSLLDRYGPFGIFFDNFEDLLSALNNTDSEIFCSDTYKESLKKMKNSRSIENSVTKLIKVINRNA